MWLRVERFRSAISTILLPFLYFSGLFTRSFASTCIWFIAPTKCGHYRRKQWLKSAKKPAMVLAYLSAMFVMSLSVQRYANKTYAQTWLLLMICYLQISSFKQLKLRLKIRLFFSYMRLSETQGESLIKGDPWRSNVVLEIAKVWVKKVTEERPEDEQVSWIGSLVAHAKYTVFPIYDNPSI